MVFCRFILLHVESFKRQGNGETNDTKQYNLIGWRRFLSFIRKRRKNGVVYLEEMENRRIDGKVRQVFLRHLGKEVDGNLKINSVKINNHRLQNGGLKTAD